MCSRGQCQCTHGCWQDTYSALSRTHTRIHCNGRALPVWCVARERAHAAQRTRKGRCKASGSLTCAHNLGAQPRFGRRLFEHSADFLARHVLWCSCEVRGTERPAVCSMQEAVQGLLLIRDALLHTGRLGTERSRAGTLLFQALLCACPG